MSEAAVPYLEEHFSDLPTQTYAARLGMWVFLATEVLFFGALFALYTSYRASFPAQFAEATRHTALALGTIMTFVLLTASLLVALGISAIRRNLTRPTALLFAGATVLGLLFLALKALEYHQHFQEGLFPGHYFRSQEIHGRGYDAFFTLYYLMTGLHFLHVTFGVIVLAGLTVLAWKGRYNEIYHTPLELGGMYWHFVDVVWLFLWPLFYLTH